MQRSEKNLPRQFEKNVEFDKFKYFFRKKKK
jgi:hypothetical protein